MGHVERDEVRAPDRPDGREAQTGSGHEAQRRLSSGSASATVRCGPPIPNLPERGAWCVVKQRPRVQELAVGGVEPPGSVFLSELEARPNWWTRSVRLPFRIRTDARLTSPIAPPN